MSKQVKLYQSEAETLIIVFDGEQQSGWECCVNEDFSAIAADILQRGWLARTDDPELAIDDSDTLCATYDQENGMLTALDDEDSETDICYPGTVACYFMGMHPTDF